MQDSRAPGVHSGARRMRSSTQPPSVPVGLNVAKALILAADQGLGDHPVYLIITRSQEAAGEALDSLPAGWAYSLGQRLVNNGLATLLFTNQDASVLEMIPPEAGPSTPNNQNPKPISPGPALS